MTTKETLTALIVNAETGEETIRELTAEEIAEREQMAAEQAQREAEQAAKEAARLSALAKLEQLGLTKEEIEAL